jgi:hypothetical protein
MYWDAVRVEPLGEYRIRVELVGGREGIFDMKPYLDHGVFRELKDLNYFRKVRVVLGAVTWPHGQDVAPETVYAAITGEVADWSVDEGSARDGPD